MTTLNTVLTRAYSPYTADIVRRIALRQGIDQSAVKSFGSTFTIGIKGEQKYLTIETKTKSVNSTVKPNITNIVIAVTSPGENYFEHISAPNIGTIIYKGEQLTAKSLTGFKNAMGQTFSGWGLWCNVHGGFVSFDNNIQPYNPVGGRQACKQIELSGLVFNADIFICIPKSL